MICFTILIIIYAKLKIKFLSKLFYFRFENLILLKTNCLFSY